MRKIVKNFKKSRLIPFLFLAALALTFTLNNFSPYPVIAQSKTGKNLIMVTSADYPPYEFRNTASGKDEIIGFDIEIAKYISQKLGYQLEIRDIDYSGVIPALQLAKADFAMAGMTPTAERKKNVDFSDIYYEGKNTIVAKKGHNLKTAKDLAGKKLGVQLGSIQAEATKKLGKVQVVFLNKTGEIVEGIKSGKIDAAIMEDTIAKGFITSNDDLEFTIIPSDAEETGSAVVFPKGSPLVNQFNLVLKEMKESGKIEKLVKKWFDASSSVVSTTNTDTNQPVPGSKKSFLSFGQIVPSIPFILEGILVTLQFTLLSTFFGLIWGVVLALCKISTIKPLLLLANGYTSIFRGTPLLLQIALVYYATPQLTGYDMPALLAGVVTFTLNSGAYISEAIRGGILAVEKGQTEASLSLGIAYIPMMKDIILPQAVKNVLPSLVNETIALLKDSSLVSTIGVVDVLRRAQIVGAEKYIYFEPLLLAGLIYYVMVMGLTWLGSRLESRLRRSN